MTGRSSLSETGLDLKKLRYKHLTRWDFIIDFKNEEDRDEALRLMDAEMTNSSTALQSSTPQGHCF